MTDRERRADGGSVGSGASGAPSGAPSATGASHSTDGAALAEALPPLDEPISAERLPAAAALAAGVAAVLGTAAAAVGAGIAAAGVAAIVAGVAAAGGARLAVQARGEDTDGGDGPPGNQSDRTIDDAGHWTDSGGRSGGRLAAAGGVLAIAGTALGLALALALATPGSTGAARLRALIAGGGALAILATLGPGDCTGSGVRRPALAAVAATPLPLLGSAVLGGGPLHAVAALATGIGDVAWWWIRVFAWWDAPIGGGPNNTLGAAVATWWLLLAALGVSLAVALTELDPARLAPRARREPIRRRIDGLVGDALFLAKVGGIGLGATLVLAAIEAPYGRVPGLRALATAVAGATILRGPLVLVLLGVLAVLVGAKLLLWAASLRNATLLAWVPAALGGLAAWLALAAAMALLADPVLAPAVDGTPAAEAAVPLTDHSVGGLLDAATDPAGIGAVGTLTAAAAGGIGVLYGGLLAADRIGAFDGPSAAGSIAIASLTAVALAGGLAEASPVGVVVPVAAGLVAWDAGAVGARMTAEAGDRAGASGPVIARVAATGVLAVVASLLAIGAVATAAGDLRPSLRVAVLVGLVGGLALGLWRAWSLATGGSGRTVTIGIGRLVALPREHPDGTAIAVGIVAGLAALYTAPLSTGATLWAGGGGFVVTRVVLSRWVVPEGGESEEAGETENGETENGETEKGEAENGETENGEAEKGEADKNEP